MGLSQRLVDRARSRPAVADPPVVEATVPAQTGAVRQVVEVEGVVSSVEGRRRGSATTLVVTLDTADGSVELRWLGGREIPGVVVGAGLRARGLLAVTPRGRVIHHPAYELGAAVRRG